MEDCETVREDRKCEYNECTVSCCRIVGPVFFDNRNYSELYTDIVHEFLEEEIDQSWFQQGRLCAICCSEIESFRKDYIHHARRICHQQTFFFFLWGQIKDNVCRKNPRNVDEPKTNITNIAVDISPMALQAVSTEILRRARLRMQYAGSHFQNFL